MERFRLLDGCRLLCGGRHRSFAGWLFFLCKRKQLVPHEVIHREQICIFFSCRYQLPCNLLRNGTNFRILFPGVLIVVLRHIRDFQISEALYGSFIKDDILPRIHIGQQFADRSRTEPLCIFQKRVPSFFNGSVPIQQIRQLLFHISKSVIGNDLVNNILLVAPDQHGPQLAYILKELILCHSKKFRLGEGLIIGLSLAALFPVIAVICSVCGFLFYKLRNRRG